MIRLFISFAFAALVPVAWCLEGWESDREAASKKAREEGKDLLIAWHDAGWKPEERGEGERILIAPAVTGPLSEKYVLVEQERTEQMDPGTFLVFADASGRPYHAAVLPKTIDQVLLSAGLAADARTKVLAAADAAASSSGAERFKRLGELFTLFAPSRSLYCPLYDEWKREALRDDKDDLSGLLREQEKTAKDKQRYEKYAYLVDSGTLPDRSVFDAPDLPESIGQHLLVMMWLQELTLSENHRLIDSSMRILTIQLSTYYPDSETVLHFDTVVGNQLRTMVSMMLIGKIRQEKGLPASLEKFDELMAWRQWSPENLQVLKMGKAMALIFADRFDEGLAEMDEAAQLAPWTKQSRAAHDFVVRTKDQKELVRALIAEQAMGNRSRQAKLDELLSLEVSLEFTINDL